MIIDSGGIKSIDKTIKENWKYVGLLKWHNDIMAFWTNSKYRFYKLKNNEIDSHKLLKVIIRNKKELN